MEDYWKLPLRVHTGHICEALIIGKGSSLLRGSGVGLMPHSRRHQVCQNVVYVTHVLNTCAQPSTIQTQGAGDIPQAGAGAF